VTVFKAAVRMRREPGHVVVRVIGIDSSEASEWIHVQAALAAEAPAQLDAAPSESASTR